MDSTIPVHDIIESLILIAIGTLALFGNGVVLYTIYKYPFLRNSFNVFVASLAVVDMFSVAFSMPLIATTLLSNSQSNSRVLCFLHTATLGFVTVITLTFLALMTINRYYRVVKPTRFQEIFSMKRSLVLSFSSSVIIFLLSAAFLAALIPVTEYTPNEIDCFHPKQPLIVCFVYLFAFVLPQSVTVVVFHFKTHRYIHKPRAAIFPTSSFQTFHLYVEEAKTLKTLLVLLISSYCCLLPGVILWLMNAMIANFPHSLIILEFACRYLANVNIPVVYIFVSRYYRRELHKIISCKCSS